MPEQRFNFTGAGERFTVPPGVTELEVEVVAAGGGTGTTVRPAYQDRSSDIASVNLTAFPTVVPLRGASSPPKVYDGDLCFIWVVATWANTDAPSTCSLTGGWDLVGTTPIATDGARSIRGWLWSRTLGSGEATGSVSVWVTPGTGRAARAAVRVMVPYLGTAFTLDNVVGDSVDSPGGATDWYPAVPAYEPTVRSARVMFFGGLEFYDLYNVNSHPSAHTIWTSSGRSGFYPTMSFGRWLTEIGGPAVLLPGTVRVGRTYSPTSAVVSLGLRVVSPAPGPEWDSPGGRGGRVVARMPCYPGDRYNVFVGQRGIDGRYNNPNGTSPYPDGPMSVGNGAATAGGQSWIGGHIYQDPPPGVSSVEFHVGAGPGGGGAARFGYCPDPPNGGGDGGFTASPGGGRPIDGWFTLGSGERGHPPTELSDGMRGHYNSGSGSPWMSSGAGPSSFTPSVSGGGGGRSHSSASALVWAKYGGGGGAGVYTYATTGGPNVQGGGGAGALSSFRGSGVELLDFQDGFNAGHGYIVVRWGALRAGWFLGTPIGGSGWSVT